MDWTYWYLACHTVLLVWVLFFGGAERLEGTLLSFVLIHPLAPLLTARLLSTYVFLSWLANLAIILLGGKR